MRLGAFAAASHRISLVPTPLIPAGSLGTGLHLCAIDVTGSWSSPPPSHSGFSSSFPPRASSLASSLSPPPPHRSALGCRPAPLPIDRQRTTVRSMLPPRHFGAILNEPMPSRVGLP